MPALTAFSSIFQALLDEQFFPEILTYDWNSLNFFKEIVVYQYQIINNFPCSIKPYYASKLLKELEIYRIINTLKSYQRIRVWKIENFISQKLNFHQIYPRISKSEEYFLRSFKNLLFTHKNLLHDDFYMRNFHGNDPDIYRNNHLGKILYRENYLFFRLLEKYILLNRDKAMQRSKIRTLTDFTYCMQYHSIRYVVFSNLVYLI